MARRNEVKPNVYKVKEGVELYPYGLHCEPIKGEVSEEIYLFLIETGKAKEEDFEQ